ncbi:6-phosphogluconate dehydrogenase C-terminal domain-like protein [Suillus paluster]|uniref:6-phosphogluconate dehydrogenase C-terminal domain-like protein n=1 Tax=Suillus paluster TaxID=48578 RepID=UPI001B8777C8|nr:6-phosphogluconate dehydrogenase C-terminal domain-like protein [Suillus paluster]KAG1744591.1 6-phosphogluconate dehydrogenase C-terminal domain-like protein [Suillus paluster]
MSSIAVISAGAMGSAVAKRLVTAGCTVYTNLDGRSEAAHQRARDAGMVDVSLETLVSKSRWILSIVPPREAFAFAEKIRGVVDRRGESPSNTHPRVFVDCNAVNPESVKRIGGLFKGTSMKFIDAGIVGGPPRPGFDPTFYACSEGEEMLEEFAALSQYGLRVSLLKGDGAGVGDASALKLCESMMKKGSIGLFMTMMLTAHRSSPATANALMKELSMSQPALMGRLIQTVPEGIPKAYRFGYEMEGLGEFVGGGEADIFKGFARVFERVAGSLAGDKADIETLMRGVEKAVELQETSNSKPETKCASLVAGFTGYLLLVSYQGREINGRSQKNDVLRKVCRDAGRYFVTV